MSQEDCERKRSELKTELEVDAVMEIFTSVPAMSKEEVLTVRNTYCTLSKYVRTYSIGMYGVLSPYTKSWEAIQGSGTFRSAHGPQPHLPLELPSTKIKILCTF